MNFVVLISGRGSNLEAMCKFGLADKIKCVISNSATAKGLDIAKAYGITSHVVSHAQFKQREDFEQELIKIIDNTSSQLVVLAGFKRILTDYFVNHYKNKIINIHPSLLPSFVGADAQSYALYAHVKVSGATIHYLTNVLDHGPIIAQGVVPVLANDTRSTLADRILALEHIMYPFIIYKIIKQQVEITEPFQVKVTKDSNDLNLLGTFAPVIFY
ncbi:MAG: phosphoribosylglycinamide formyltransferase [Burkholderiales bacterium]|jgi:phosphoribosylglycinamide formyltransferase-1|nr:phosphoribosylglycinamide formyltransferase [Burkholderiales bacterium]